MYKRQGCKDLNEYLQKRIADRKEQAQSVEKRNDTLSKNCLLYTSSGQFTQELTAQIQSADNQYLEITQEVPAQFPNVAKTVATIYKIKIEDIEDLFLASPIARINWASHMVILNNPLPDVYKRQP